MEPGPHGAQPRSIGVRESVFFDGEWSELGLSQDTHNIIKRYFITECQNCVLGKVAKLHTVWADIEPLGKFFPQI